MAAVERVFIFADLCGYTALTETHGDEGAARVATRFTTLARHVLDRLPGARLVKTLGDGVLIVASDVAAALTLVAELEGALDREQDFPEMRVGVHAGTAIEVAGDWFGAAVNLCSRLAAQAVPGSVVCSERVARDGTALRGFRFLPLGAVELKNVRDPVLLYQVVITGHAGPAADVDPVCRMRVDRGRAVKRELEGSVVYFCSERCAGEFDAAPERFRRGSVA